MNLQEIMDAIQPAEQTRTKVTLRDGTEAMVVHYPLRSYAMPTKFDVRHANALRQFLQKRITDAWLEQGLIGLIDPEHLDEPFPRFSKTMYGVTGRIERDRLSGKTKYSVEVSVWLRDRWLHRMMLDFPLFADLLMVSATGEEFPEGTKEEDRIPMLTLVANELIDDVSYMDEFCIDFFHETTRFKEVLKGVEIAVQWHINKLIKERMKKWK